VIPVAVIITCVGIIGFIYARQYIFDQWTTVTRLKLEKAAHQISMRLDEKLGLVNLIDQAQSMPHAELTQAFLVQELVELPGVRFIDIMPLEEGELSPENLGRMAGAPSEGLYTMELCGDFGFCAPTMNTAALDRALRIVKTLPPTNGNEGKRLLVRIGFESFLAPLTEMDMLKGSHAALVTSSGVFLAHTNRDIWGRQRLGDTGDPFELEALKQISMKHHGQVLGDGAPPERVVSFYKIDSINWYLVLFSKGEIILAPIVRFSQIYIITALGTLVVVILLIGFVTRPIGRSISRISEAAQKVQDGDYSVKLPEKGSDEIALLNSSFNNMIRGLRQREWIERTFGRYVDRKVAEELLHRPESLKLGGDKATVTIMMADLRNFTAASERLQPEDVIAMLNRYFARMISVVERYKGIIVDFYGDAILVFFNGVDPDLVTRTADALNCAMDMQREMEGFKTENQDLGLPALGMGVGIHTGEVIVGNIGAESRAKYGIVGSNVNLTARIQSAASAGKVVISEQTHEILAERMDVSREFSVCLKGVEGVKTLYEIDATSSSCIFPGNQ
jgi:class 3 adenylate cyclase